MHFVQVNEFCALSNKIEDIDHVFLHREPAARIISVEHFLPLLNKVLFFKVNKTTALLLLKLFPVKVERKSYLLTLHLVKLILYQLWNARCSCRFDQTPIHPKLFIKLIEAETKVGDYRF